MSYAHEWKQEPGVGGQTMLALVLGLRFLGSGQIKAKAPSASSYERVLPTTPRSQEPVGPAGMGRGSHWKVETPLLKRRGQPPSS